MKTLGLLGGMSWESTQTYYRLLNQQVGARLGGLHSARLVLYSVDFAEIERLQHSGDWDATADILIDAAGTLQAAGAEGLVLCTNTMHKVAPRIEAAVPLPLLHVADATAAALKADGIDCVGLIGTRFTMEQAFYKDRLTAAGIDVRVPNDAQRERIHAVIFNELCRGEIRDDARRDYLAIIDALQAEGAQGVILGCTEVGLLVGQADTPVALYDTTEIHARQAVAFALGEDLDPT